MADALWGNRWPTEAMSERGDAVGRIATDLASVRNVLRDSNAGWCREALNRHPALVARLHAAVLDDSFEESLFRPVRQIAPVTFVISHARTHMEDNEMTQRNLAQLANSQGF